MTPTLSAFLDVAHREQATEVVSRTHATFAECIDALYAARFTGRVYLDFSEGRPKLISIANPVRVTITSS